MSIFSRMHLILTDADIARIENLHVLVIGIGGVGSFAAEALARSGVKRITLVDHDIVDATNINRQLLALHSTIGKAKVDVLKARLEDINPEIIVTPLHMKYDLDTHETIFSTTYDFVVDAFDSLKIKAHLMIYCVKNAIPLISSMGMANKFDPTKVEIIDLFKTYNDPVARYLRQQMRANRITKKIPVVFSSELPLTPRSQASSSTCFVKQTPGSNAFVPSTAGIVMASYVINKQRKGD